MFEEKREDRLTYQIISPEDRVEVAQMTAFINHHYAGHFLQQPRWAGVKENWRWRGILVHRRGALVGCMSVLIYRGPMGISLLYAPRGPVCHREDPAVWQQLLQGVQTLGKLWRSVLFLTDPDQGDPEGSFQTMLEGFGFRQQVRQNFGNIQAQNVMRVPLAGLTQEQVLAAMNPKTRYNIRLAGRKGVTVRKFYGHSEIPAGELAAFTALMEQTGERDGFCTRGEGYFRRVLESYGRDAVLFMAYLDEEPLAGTIGIFTAGKSWYLYGASGNSHRNTMPNYLLQWEMLRHAMAQGCSYYDLRGVPGVLDEQDPLYGLYRFKKGFGAEMLHFTGLFILELRPFLGKACMAAVEVRRWLCTCRCHRTPRTQKQAEN